MSASAALAHNYVQSPSEEFQLRRNICPVKLGDAGDLTLAYSYHVGPQGVVEEDLLIRVDVKGNAGSVEANVSSGATERGLPNAFASAVAAPEAGVERTGMLPVKLGDSGLGYLRVPVERDASGQCLPGQHAILVQLRQDTRNANQCVVSGALLPAREAPSLKERSRLNRGLRLGTVG